MLVFFRNIPAHTKHSHLIAFVEPALKMSWFRKNGVIEEVKVIEQFDSLAKETEFHGLVTIEPGLVANKVIQRLNRKLLLGRQVIVREYYRRSWHNDLRVTHKSSTPEILSKRVADRRRQHLELVKDISKQFSGHKTFYRHY
ncbi:hypothetical protein [Methyloprofundus sp.]|uniref:hypothetical protein n=1 Tax=Methyloprofundus sp. TaxID=2020875 RepID=UPI003D0B19F3